MKETKGGGGTDESAMNQRVDLLTRVVKGLLLGIFTGAATICLTAEEAEVIGLNFAALPATVKDDPEGLYLYRAMNDKRFLLTTVIGDVRYPVVFKGRKTAMEWGITKPKDDQPAAAEWMAIAPVKMWQLQKNWPAGYALIDETTPSVGTLENLNIVTWPDEQAAPPDKPDYTGDVISPNTGPEAEEEDEEE